MYILLIVIFIVGYILIAFEHPLKIDKAAFALLTGVLCWTGLIYGAHELIGHAASAGAEGHDLQGQVHETLLYHLGEIAEILFFLMGAMTIVELVDAHQGFRIFTDRIRTTNRVKLMWFVCVITFFFSAALDNLTTSIIMAALLKKLVSDRKDLWFFGGMVVIAANAGGAWSPIGDVTTIMLWIGGQVTAFNIIKVVFIPSVFCMLAPLAVVSYRMKGNVERPDEGLLQRSNHVEIEPSERNLIFWLGVGGLLFVPIFKNVTHLPPFMGMLFSLGALWVASELIHRRKDFIRRHELSVSGVIRRIDTPSILFFLGILLAVSSLQTAGHLADMAIALENTFGNMYIVNTLIGLLSAIVDNVPLVAGAMGMYSMDVYPQDDLFWELLAYCAGTGGSALIIGSAAGVAIMGLLKIDFIWYMKRISLLALLGYFVGLGVMILLA